MFVAKDTQTAGLEDERRVSSRQRTRHHQPQQHQSSGGPPWPCPRSVRSDIANPIRLAHRRCAKAGLRSRLSARGRSESRCDEACCKAGRTGSWGTRLLGVITVSSTCGTDAGGTGDGYELAVSQALVKCHWLVMAWSTTVFFDGKSELVGTSVAGCCDPERVSLSETKSDLPPVKAGDH